MKNKNRVRLGLAVAMTAGCAAVASAGGSAIEGVSAITVHEGTDISVALSPDRSTLVMDLQGVLFSSSVRGGKAHALTDALYDARQPCWYADGTRIAFQSDRDGHWRIWSIRPDGSDPKVLTPGPFEGREPACSPDSKHIAFTSDRSGNLDIWEVNLDDGGLRQVTRNTSGESRPSYSPDGEEIAYVSERDRALGVYAITTGGKERVIATTKPKSGGGTVLGTPTWTPNGKHILYTLVADGSAQLLLDGKVLSADEDVHPFRGAWLSADEFLYCADGHIKHRSLATGKTTAVDFRAVLQVRRPIYTRRPQKLSDTTPEAVLGLLKPVVSPDGARITFAAFGQLWLMDVGGKPHAVTQGGSFVVTDPAWSADGSKIVYSSDQEDSLNLWVYEVASGTHHRLTTAPGAQMHASWSPDGTRIAFVSPLGEYYYDVQVIELATGKIVTVQPSSFGPGYPSWSADGRSLMVSRMAEYSPTQTYNVGATNQIEVLSADGLGKARGYTPVAHHSIGTRSAADGPVWSPDGRSIAFQMDQALWVMPVSGDGTPAGAPRKLADGLASYISWTGDSSRLLYVDVNELTLIQVADGRKKVIPVDMTWRRDVPTGRLVIHAGNLVDGVHSTGRSDVDIVVERNRIVAIEPHKANRPSGKAIDASRLTVMPGLMDMHEHLTKEYGSSFGRLLLAYGITTVRCPGSIPAEVIEEREASAAGLRPSPRVFATGYILDGERSFWELSTPVADFSQVDREIDRARKLKYDLLKTYVHMSEPVRERLVEGAHSIGIPVSSHEIYPAALFGSDSVEHLDGDASAGRGYSTKASALNKVYDDVVQILRASQMTVTPTISLFTPTEKFAGADSRNDARWLAQPSWVRAQGPDSEVGPPQTRENIRRDLVKLHRAGVRIITGTDAPLTLIGLTEHNELEQLVRAGLTPFEALQMATVVPAELLAERADLGSIEVGKLADMVVVEGDPLTDIRSTRNVRKVIVNGRVYGSETLPLGNGH